MKNNSSRNKNMDIISRYFNIPIMLRISHNKLHKKDFSPLKTLQLGPNLSEYYITVTTCTVVS